MTDIKDEKTDAGVTHHNVELGPPARLESDDCVMTLYLC